MLDIHVFYFLLIAIESLRVLGYPRLVSVQNFREPNFHLVGCCFFFSITFAAFLFKCCFVFLFASVNTFHYVGCRNSVMAYEAVRSKRRHPDGH